MPLRYVILWHTNIEEPHYDLMFETSPGSALATWRSPVWPILTSTSLIKLRDHRPAFLNFQGTLSQDRGVVTQIDSGTCEIKIETPTHWTITRPEGSLALRHIAEDRWEASAE